MINLIISGQSIEQTHLGSNGKFYLNKLPDPNSDKLIIASSLGRNVKALLQKGATPKSINANPTVSPLIPHRGAVNLVMQQAEFQGRDPIFSPDGKQVVIQDGNTIRLYDLRTGNKQAEFQGHSPGFSPDGKQVVTAKDGYTFWLYDLMGKKQAEFRFSK